MKRLEKTVSVRNTGILGLTATLVKREGMAAIYLRDDGVYEVGIIKVAKPKEIFGEKYPMREVYWGNEDFGKIASTTNSKERAEVLLSMYKVRAERLSAIG